MSSKTIVITGVSRGLGLAMTERFVELGHTVIGCARREEKCQELSQKFGAPHAFTPVNVADDGQVEAWAQSTLETNGPPELLLNNAAIINANAALWETPPEEFSRLVDINIKGVYHVIRHFVTAMIEHGSGVIVNFSSGWGRSTSPEVAPYCSSKWAIEGMTQALAAELPRGMAAIPLNPGIIHTEMLDSCFGSHASAYPSPQQWAKTAVPFLLELGAKDNGRALTAP